MYSTDQKDICNGVSKNNFGEKNFTVISFHKRFERTEKQCYDTDVT